MTRTNPSIMMPNGICVQNLRQNWTYGKELGFGHSVKSLSPPIYTTIFDSDEAVLSPFKEIYGAPDARTSFKPYHGVSIDHFDPSVTDSASREALTWKTIPCKHYTRTQGWCPVGERCQFIHDLTLQPSGYINESRGSRWPDSDIDKISGTAQLSAAPRGGKTRLPKSHCWSHIQGYCDVLHCRYFHPKDIRPYMKYTPCLYWLDCADKMKCPFKHPAKIPEATTLGPSQVSKSIPTICYPSFEANGTTYFDLMGQVTSYNYSLASRPTTSSQDKQSCDDHTNTISMPPPPPPPSPVFGEEHPENKDISVCINSCEHDTLNDQRPTSPQITRQHGHTRRFSVAFKGSQVIGKEHCGNDESFTITELWVGTAYRKALG